MPSTRRHTIFDRWRQQRHGATPTEPSERDPLARERDDNILTDVARKWGYALTEMLTGVRPDFEKRAMRHYYQDPSDPARIWSGSGLKPQWVRQWEADGHSLDELRVRPPH